MTIDQERRRTLKCLAALAGIGLGAAHANCNPRRLGRASGGSTVACARREKIVPSASGMLDSALLASMLGSAVARSVGTASPEEAFRKLFRPTDVVGIKVNTLAGRGLSSRPEVVAQLVTWLGKARIPAERIVIWDRSDRELSAAGFHLNRASNGVRCFGTNDDYEWTPREWGAGASCFAGVLVRELTALINVGVLKDHDLAGISAGMKNLYGVIHNPNKYHDNGCSPYVAHLAAHPLIRDKLRLTVIDGLVAQCHGGPARSPRWSWDFGGVLVSRDPVAVDAVAYKIIEDRRRQQGLRSLVQEGREPKWIAEAAGLGLGESRLGRIEMVKA